ncbi:hypothetical protein [Herpetosiphon geysericola]|uniref:Response regulatory domain-containing protein n=1 Tax=Herpetosiphon geysericola TaxID=70996 RepID=A0A0P6Z0H9_9CHLR|nr:hypothetical protein [Herpetosiphon geysericola]KPL90371.1 hypothetical protein SE18_07110 [Herpetosiphon geysericola]
MQPLIMLVAQTAAIPPTAEELIEQGYRIVGCDRIQQALDTIDQLKPDLIYIIDHFIEGFRDPLGIYFYTRDILNQPIPIILIGFRHIPEHLAHLDLACFNLMQIEATLSLVYELVPI